MVIRFWAAWLETAQNEPAPVVDLTRIGRIRQLLKLLSSRRATERRSLSPHPHDRTLTPTSKGPGQLVRKTFNVPKINDGRARRYITALGLYEAYLNGTRIGDEWLAPGWTAYQHRIQCQVFDVKSLSKSDRPNVQSEKWAKDDGSWECQVSPIVASGIYDCEKYNLGLKVKDWHHDQKHITKAGYVVADSQTALALALLFDLHESPAQRRIAAERLARLVQYSMFRVSTGFAGTPAILHPLSETGHVQHAYRMLLETGCPSWLYLVCTGATTVWERWDSMLADGSINPGEMTSFNHYALGSVANWMHARAGGLWPLEPGWKRFGVRPRPRGDLKHAEIECLSPNGGTRSRWGTKAAGAGADGSAERHRGGFAARRERGEDDRVGGLTRSRATSPPDRRAMAAQGFPDLVWTLSTWLFGMSSM